MYIRFLGATEEVTGSRTLLTIKDEMKILIDFGMTQSSLGQLEESLRWNGRDFEFDVGDIDYLILTHAHADHSALTPLLIKRGFKGKIIATAPTAEFCAISLPDAAKIMQSNCDWANKRRPKNKLKPLYTIEEAEETIRHIRCYDYNTEIILSNNVKLELLNAGHMLGAAMPKITYTKNGKSKVIIFTGDTSAQTGSKPFLDPSASFGKVDYIVTESTYGDRVHEKKNPQDELERVVLETCIYNKKTLVIPVFSMQRSSEVLWMLREIYLKNLDLYKVPIYLDSPMAIKSQLVMDNNREYWGEKWLERDKELTNIFNWEIIEYIEDYKESIELDNDYPKIILSSSGMCSGGRILYHLQNFLPKKGCKVLFVGYQAEGTLGEKLLNTKHKSISINRQQVIIRADIEKINMSSHADMNQITEYIKSADKKKLKKVILNHGEPEAMKNLQNELYRHLKNVEIILPKYNEKIRL